MAAPRLADCDFTFPHGPPFQGGDARSDPAVARHGDIECHLLPALANRHGLITGATGTGKTITLQTLAENFSRIGVPVFMADVKGDLTGITQKGTPRPSWRPSCC